MPPFRHAPRWKMDRSPIFLPDNGLRFPRLDEYAGGRDAQEDVVQQFISTGRVS